MRVAIAGIGILAFLLGACTPDPSQPGPATNATAKIPIPAICPVIPAFPAGSRQMGPAEIRTPSTPPQGFKSETTYARWEGIVLGFVCMCHESVDLEAELAKPGGLSGAASGMLRTMAASDRTETISSRTREAPPIPGFDTVAISNNKALIIRSRSVAKGKCMSSGIAVEPNPVVRENRTVSDRWFENWRYPDGRPLALAPLSEEWNRTRFQ
jgi:hypothetical protein